MDNGSESLEVEKLIHPAMEVIGEDRIDFTHTLLANKLESQKANIEKARAFFDKIPNSHADKPLLANKIGVILFALGVPEKAAEYFRRALILLTDTKHPQRTYIEHNLFHALLNKESYEAALSYMMQGNEECSLFDVDRYKPIKILGAGGMGVTFLCEDSYEEQEVVVKTLWRNAGGTIKDVFSEALIAKKINDPRVLNIYDIRRHKGDKPYIVMEYFEGIDLYKYVLENNNKEPLPIEETLHIILEVAKGMASAHYLETPIIHRDIKPNNILYNPQTKEIKIIDFGIACMSPNAQEITDTVTVNSNNIIAKKMLGTLGYMAPEQQRGDKNIDVRADIFSLGKTLMFLLTAKTPPTENIMAISNINIRKLVGDTVGHCLMPEAKDRYDTKTLIKNLESLIENINQIGEPTEAPNLTAMTVEDEALMADEIDFADDDFDIDDMPQYTGDDMSSSNKPNNANQQNSNQQQFSEEDEKESEPMFGTDSIVISPDDMEEDNPINTQVSESMNPNLGESYVISGDWDDDNEEETSNIPETREVYPVDAHDNRDQFADMGIPTNIVEPTISMEDFNDNFGSPIEGNALDIGGDFDTDPVDVDMGENLEAAPIDVDMGDEFDTNFTSDSVDMGGDFDTGFTDPSGSGLELANSQTQISVVREDVQEEFDRKKMLGTIRMPDGFSLDEESGDIICERDGSLMIFIPQGVFLMGSNAAEAMPFERIEHEINVGGFFMDQCPINWLQYNHFCDVTKRKKPQKPCWDLDDSEPIVNISWEDAQAYAIWSGKALPTEAQWEKAAKGGLYFDGDSNKQHKNTCPDRRYPWGNKNLSHGGWKANCQYEPEYGDRGTSPVGSYPKGASPYGCLDMAGNVWEWCNDWFDENYYLQSPNADPQGPRTGNGKVIRGGAWNSEHKFVTTTYRGWMETDKWWNIIGFRTVFKL